MDIIVVTLAAFVIGSLLGICNGQSRSKAKIDSYWKGRLEGWMACENMVLERIEETGKKLSSCTREKMWEDLVA